MLNKLPPDVIRPGWLDKFNKEQYGRAGSKRACNKERKIEGKVEKGGERCILKAARTYPVFREISLDGKLSAADIASKVPLPLVVRSLLVILQSGAVAEGGRAEMALDGLSGVDAVKVARERGAAGEGGVALVARKLPLRVVRLDVAGEGLLVLEGGAAHGAREGGARGAVQVLVDREVVLPGKLLEAEGARKPLEV